MKDKFITIGISSRVPIEYQILIWKLYDSMPTPKDYLQFFNLYTKAESQIIHHYAEQPKYEQTLALLTDSPITEKIYVIDDGELIGQMAAENLNLFEKVCKALSDFIERIRNTLHELMNDPRLKRDVQKYRGVANLDSDFAEMQALWNTSLERAVAAHSQVDGEVNNENVGEDRYSVKNTRNIEWNEQLNQVENKALIGSNSLYLGNMDNLESVGFSSNPFAMNQSDYRKSRRKQANNKNYSKHGVPLKTFKSLPEYLNNAVMFIYNGNKVTVITDCLMSDTNGNPSYVIAGVWQNQKMDNDTVNQIKSIYPLDDFANVIRNYAKKGNLIITNKNKADNMLAPMGVQPSEREAIISLAKESLPQIDDNVKQNIVEGKNSFGDEDEQYLQAVTNLAA